MVRQRPGTAKGFVFLLIEDETGLTNVVVRPQLYDEQRSVVRGAAYVLVEGIIENQSGTLNLIARIITPLDVADGSPEPALRSPYPGNPDDPREKPVEELARAIPDSHNFH